MSNHCGITSRSVTAQDDGALGKTHFIPGKMSVNFRTEVSSLSKSSEQKVLASLPRPWRKMMVWVWGAVGATMCGVVTILKVVVLKVVMLKVVSRCGYLSGWCRARAFGKS